MKFLNSIYSITMLCGLMACGEKLEQKGFAVPSVEQDAEAPSGLVLDSLTFPTKPSNVILTGNPMYRLATIYKVNYKRDSSTFIGQNEKHYNYSSLGESRGNQWNNNYMPGLESLYGYNLVNVSLFNMKDQQQSFLFNTPVLIKTLYYPSFSKDTLNFKPINRNYYLVSVFDEDTNKDGFINVRDLTRFYCFDISGSRRSPIVPMDYSVYKSEYDPANDVMLVFARLDKNKNGQIDELEPVNIFWVDLNEPERVGKFY